jgi:tetratricopeptide (TPR) repeat protein
MNLEEYKATQARLQNWAGELLCYGKTDQAIEVWNDALELAEVQNDTLTNKTEILCMLVNLHFQVANQENDPLMLSKELSVNGMGDDDHENTNQEDISRRQLLARRQSKLIKPGLEEKYHRQQAKRYLHRIKAGLVQPAWLGPPTKALKDFFCEAEAWELAIIITDQLLFQNGQDQDCQQLATMHYHVASHKLDAQRHSEALQHLQATVTYLQKIPADARDMTLYLQVLHLLATEYHSQQQYDSALETYKEQMVHSPKAEKPSLHCQMAQVFIAKGELDRALEQIELAKRLEETSPDSIISQLLQTKGDVYCRLGRVEDSLECYQEALHETENSPPEKAKLLYTMGRLSVKIGRIRNAITYFTRELEITKQELGKNHLSVSRVLHELARLYDEGLGEHKMALMKYNKALHVELAVLEDCHRQISDCPNCNPVSHRMCTKHANLQRNISTRIRETKKSQGRIHYKLGDFERAMQASFVESPISSEQEKKKGRRRRTTHQLSY